MDNKTKVLDIAMNLNRIGNWAADGYSNRQARIHLVLDQTSGYIASIKRLIEATPLQPTFYRFLKEYTVLEKEGRSPKDEIVWAEKMMTWGNILTHRAKLLE